MGNNPILLVSHFVRMVLELEGEVRFKDIREVSNLNISHRQLLAALVQIFIDF